MAQEGWFYDGTTWRESTEVWFYDGTTWREATEGWIYTGTTWQQWWSTTDPATLDTATAGIGQAAADGCSAGKCYRCIEWTTTSATIADHHIRILKSTGGGSYAELVDDLTHESTCGACSTAGCSSFPLQQGCYCDTCVDDGTSTQYKVRLEEDGTDNLVGDSVERTTSAVSNCTIE